MFFLPKYFAEVVLWLWVNRYILWIIYIYMTSIIVVTKTYHCLPRSLTWIFSFLWLQCNAWVVPVDWYHITALHILYSRLNPHPPIHPLVQRSERSSAYHHLLTNCILWLVCLRNTVHAGIPVVLVHHWAMVQYTVVNISCWQLFSVKHWLVFLSKPEYLPSLLHVSRPGWFWWMAVYWQVFCAVHVLVLFLH